MKIKSQSSTWAGIFSLVSVITIAFMGTYVYLMWRAGRAGWLVYLVTAPFFLMGAILGGAGLRGLLRLLRFGHWHLEISGPGALGRPLRAKLLPRRDVTPAGEIRCDLRCLDVTIVNTGKNQRMDTKTLWETSWNVTSPTIPKDEGLSLSLPLPAGARATTQASNGGAGIKWQLTVLVRTRGLSDEPIFDVPVVGG
jgi:hypothetical protein